MKPLNPEIRQRIDQAAYLRATGANNQEAADLLGITRDALRDTIRSHSLDFGAALQQARKRLRAKRRAFIRRQVPRQQPAEDIPAHTRDSLEKAAAMSAAGVKEADIVAALGLAANSVAHYRTRYRDTWKALKRRWKGLKWIPSQWTQAPAVSEESLMPQVQASVDMKLTEFFEQYVIPLAYRPHNASPKTIKEAARSLEYWKRFTGDPAIKDISLATCATFVVRLSASPGKDHSQKMSPNTVRKHCGVIQRCLNLCGPRNRDNRLGAGVIENPAWVDMPRARIKIARDSFTLAEISDWLAVCELADTPQGTGVAPAAWWRALLRFLYNTGLRLGTAVEITWSMIDGHWLEVPGDAIKGKQPRAFWLNDVALRAIKTIRTDHPRVFPWPDEDVEAEKQALQGQRRRLLKATSIDPKRRFGFHGLRKALASQLAGVNPMIAQMQLGHTTEGTTRRHYVHPDTIGPVMAAIPQPGNES